MSQLIAIPAPIDPHVHLRDLDWVRKATFTSETAAAIAGGYWAIFDMPNTPPTTTTRAALDTKLAALHTGALCDWSVYLGAAQSDNRVEYAATADEVCGLKMFCNATTGDLLIEDPIQREQHFAAWPAHRLIAVHAEGETVLDILALVRRYRKHTHFLHISTAGEIGYLRAAKEEGLPITLGVCPHHLYLTEADIPVLKGFGIMKPGLKTAADRDALWNALALGIVDVIESDHAPHTRAEKESVNPPYGVPGLETTLPLLLTSVAQGRLTMEQVVALISTNPRRTWNIATPPGTYTRVEIGEAYVLDRQQLHGACGWSPFEGMQLNGRIRETWIRGTKVYDGENILVEAGFGQPVTFEASV